MALANVSLSDTFDVQRTRLNQTLTSVNQLDTVNVFSVISNSAPLVVAGSSLRGANVYLSLTVSTNNADVSSTNVASPLLVNTAAQIARGAFNNANTTLVTASAAFAAANNVNTAAGAAYAQANAAFITASGAFAAANASPGSLALATAQSAYGLANTVNVRDNAAVTTAQSAYAQSNGAFITASAAYGQANASFITTSSAFGQANAAFSKANVVANTGVAGISRFATAAEYRTGTANTISLDPSDVWASAQEVALTDAATITIDFSTFLNANVTLGNNRTLGTPTNLKTGQTGYIRVVQDATGSRTLAYASGYVFTGQTAPTLSTAPGAHDLLFYQHLATGNVFISSAIKVGI